VSYIIIWCSSSMWPLYQSYIHEDIMANKLDTLTKSTQLADLLRVPEGYECNICPLCLSFVSHISVRTAFLSFAQAEFNSESVVCFLAFFVFCAVHFVWCGTHHSYVLLICHSSFGRCQSIRCPIVFRSSLCGGCNR
jgi:hypothetical protein